MVRDKEKMGGKKGARKWKRTRGDNGGKNKQEKGERDKKERR